MPVFFASSTECRFNVGRSGSSDEGELLAVVESVLAVVLSELLRFIVGRSGSSAGVDVLLVVEPVLAEEVDEVVDAPELSRRFIVGRSGSALVELVAVVDAVVVSGVAEAVLVLLWSLPVAGAGSAVVLFVR